MGGSQTNAVDPLKGHSRNQLEESKCHLNSFY
jgi:hypothetical protein